MPVNSIEAVIFDCDGVIVDSTPLMKQAEQAATVSLSQDYDLPYRLPEQEWTTLHGLNRKDMAAKLFGVSPESQIAEEYRLRVVARILEQASPVTVPLITGIKPFMSFVQQNNCQIGAATNSSRAVFDRFLRIHDIDIIPSDYTVAAGEAGKNKPNPEPYLEVMRRMNTSPDRTLIVDDSLPGILAGRYAGALVMAPSTTLTYDYLRANSGAHIVVGTYAEAAQRIRPLLRN